MKRIKTNFTDNFDLEVPIICAPMAGVTGSELASSVAKAGGLGLVAGGYGEIDFTKEHYGKIIGQKNVGIGYINWKIEKDSQALDWVLEQKIKPAAIFLSFGNFEPWVSVCNKHDVKVIAQIGNLEEAKKALSSDISAIVIQSNSAGGHGRSIESARDINTLLPELKDYLLKNKPDVSLIAAGGISNGRGLVAALALGADGVMLGTRFLMSQESLTSIEAKKFALDRNGDDTIKSLVFDLLRNKDWPSDYAFRTLKNKVTDKWNDNLIGLKEDLSKEQDIYNHAVLVKDFEYAHVAVGEGIGSIKEVLSSKEIIDQIMNEAEHTLIKLNSFIN